MTHASPFYRMVKTILVNGYDQQPLAGMDEADPYAPGARFAREAATLFDPERDPLIH